MMLIVIVSFIYLVYYGYSYYRLPIEQRFFSEAHNFLKPSGALGHGLGIFGTLFMIIGVFGYMIRKRKKSLARVGVLKHWLEFHIFLCTLGPIMVLFHTAFKFGGIVAISFWSMVAVVISGVIGRFIYNQIPRSIQGRELSLNEVKTMQLDAASDLEELSDEAMEQISKSMLLEDSEARQNLMVKLFKDYFKDLSIYTSIKESIKAKNLRKSEEKQILRLVKFEIQLRRKISRLQEMQKLFRSWHVVHLPFALIMLVIMVIHVLITLTFGYKWIF